MPTIKITDSDGGVFTGTLPTSWHDTPLGPYVAIATATTMPETCSAVAQLLGVPAEVFLSDVSHLLPIKAACPWLFDGSLPEESAGALTSFLHQGQLYNHVGNLEKISAEQMEALLSFLNEHQGKPLAAAPSLLAVLYSPHGYDQTPDVVEVVAKAFELLPMATAWPALAFFLSSSSKPALLIQTVSALEKQTLHLLETLEEAVQTAGDSRTYWSRTRRWLTRRWLRHAKKALW